MARSDELADHDGTTCGQCHYQILGAEVAREMIEAGEYEDVVGKWAAEHKRRWEKSKFVKLWEKEKKAGRDPRKAFKDAGVGAVSASFGASKSRSGLTNKESPSTKEKDHVGRPPEPPYSDQTFRERHARIRLRGVVVKVCLSGWFAWRQKAYTPPFLLGSLVGVAL